MASTTHAESSTPTPIEPDQDASSGSRISIHLPTSFVVLPPVAGLIGLGIGMSRGGSRARLRFLAENAHRPPTTYRGWYFYTKTRNYRILYGALRTGGKYALALSSATLAYVVLDEGVGVARESLVGEKGWAQWREEESEGMPRRVGWRKGGVWWGDGLVAGGLLGVGVGALYRLPRPLFVRSAVIGMIMGGTTSGLQTVQAKIGQLREAQEKPSTPLAEAASVEVLPPTSLERPAPTATLPEVSADTELPQIPQQPTEGGWSRLWSWIPGMSR